MICCLQDVPRARSGCFDGAPRTRLTAFRGQHVEAESSDGDRAPRLSRNVGLEILQGILRAKRGEHGRVHDRVPWITAVREKTGLSGEEVRPKLLASPCGLLQEWEQGGAAPSGARGGLLLLIAAKEPSRPARCRLILVTELLPFRLRAVRLTTGCMRDEGHRARSAGPLTLGRDGPSSACFIQRHVTRTSEHLKGQRRGGATSAFFRSVLTLRLAARRRPAESLLAPGVEQSTSMPVGFRNLITPPGRIREPHHRDDRDAGREPRPTPSPAPPADVSGGAA